MVPEDVPYSIKVEEVQRATERVTRLYGTGRWAAVGGITWATAGLLGAFATQLAPREMGAVLTLAVLAVARFYAAHAFSRLLTAPLPPLSQQPSRLAVRPDQDPRRNHVTRLRRISSFIGFLLCAFTAAIALEAFRLLHRRHIAHENPTPNSHNNLNLYWGLLAFYILCILDAAFLALATFYSAASAARFGADSDHSLVRYYDHLLSDAFKRRSAISGFRPLAYGRVDPSYFFRFAYEELLGGDCRRNVQPRIIALQYKDMLRHLYEAEQQGRKLVKDFLRARDTAVQLAAANVVGLWISEEMGLGIRDAASGVTTTEIVEALLEKVGGGQVGWAATNSLAAMAENPNARSLLRQLNLQQKVGDKLVKVTDPKSSRSLVVVRAIVSLVYGQIQDLDEKPSGQGEDAVLGTIFSDAEIIEKLKKDLETLMTSARIHRLRVLAAYLYALLGCDPPLDPLLKIHPASDSYWLSSETAMLKQLYDRFVSPMATGRELPTMPEEIREDCAPSTPKRWMQATNNQQQQWKLLRYLT